MIDFSNCKELISTYGGSEKKKKIVFDGKTYLLKFPDPVREKGNSLSYMNNQYSEYIGCHIMESLGIEVQKTILGVYDDLGKEKVVVACEDFTSDDTELIEFSKLANSVTGIDNAFKCTIEDVYVVIKNSSFITDSKTITDKFWDMFVADALIGNPDRHLDNWGLLYNNKTNSYVFAPVYDCGSCLHAVFSLNKKRNLLDDEAEMKNISYNVNSVYSINGRRLSYSQAFANPSKDLEKAMMRIIPRINIDEINGIIDSIVSISDEEKRFYKESIRIRKELIIDKNFKKITRRFSDNRTKLVGKFDFLDEWDSDDIDNNEVETVKCKKTLKL